MTLIAFWCCITKNAFFERARFITYEGFCLFILAYLHLSNICRCVIYRCKNMRVWQSLVNCIDNFLIEENTKAPQEISSHLTNLKTFTKIDHGPNSHKGFSQVLSWNVQHKSVKFKLKPWLSPFVNTGSEVYIFESFTTL